MEYFIGSLITLLLIIIFNIKINKLNNYKTQPPFLSQSNKYNLLKKYYIQTINYKSISKKFKKHSSRKKGIVVEDNAYWIENGFLVCANVEYGDINFDTVKRVDTYNLDSVELDKIQFIVEKLTEGNDDSSNTGH